MEIKKLQEIVMIQAAKKGFGVKPEDISVPEKIALIHSEVSEAYEAWRKKNIDGKHGFAEELADISIRVFHLAGVMGVNLEKEITSKIEHNQERDWNWDQLNEKHL